MTDDQMPTSTKWTRDAVGDTGRKAVDSVYMIVCPQTGSKGTGFLLESGQIITNHHVVSNCQPGQIKAISATSDEIRFSEVKVDPHRDLAALNPIEDLKGGLELDVSGDFEPGEQVSTWGFPLGYSGPSPILSVGYLAGFQQSQTQKGLVKELVVNGAFNNGNSGGPLFMSGDNSVIGVVVSKHAPFTPFQRQALEILENQQSGFQYTATDPQGNDVTFSEAQLVADLLNQFTQLTQVMIGHAIHVSELSDFLEENNLSVPTTKSSE